jgi:hypothetical protein
MLAACQYLIKTFHFSINQNLNLEPKNPLAEAGFFQAAKTTNIPCKWSA